MIVAYIKKAHFKDHPDVCLNVKCSPQAQKVISLQMVWLFGKSVELFGEGALLKTAGHSVVDLRFLNVLPAYALLSNCLCSVISSSPNTKPPLDDGLRSLSL